MSVVYTEILRRIYSMSTTTSLLSFFVFNDTATTDIYTLSHTTLFRSLAKGSRLNLRGNAMESVCRTQPVRRRIRDRKSTRLNSSHVAISYAVFCLKKKKYST